MSTDAAVQKTNDDATQCKAACVALGYFEDHYVRQFVRKPVTKPPLINRGYYARQKSIAILREQFNRACTDGGAPSQVLSLGAGYDTSYFQLKSEGTVFSKYVELDFDEVVCKKVMTLSSKEALRSVVEAGNPCDVDKKYGTVLSPEYCLLPTDLRDLEQVEAALQKAGVDFDAPTFILSECVLVYMMPAESEALLKKLASMFTTCAVVVCSLCNPVWCGPVPASKKKKLIGNHAILKKGFGLSTLEGVGHGHTPPGHTGPRRQTQRLQRTPHNIASKDRVANRDHIVSHDSTNEENISSNNGIHLSTYTSLTVYEQIKPDSMFGRQMIRNLEERGAPLYGVHCTPTLDAHKERLLSCGWQRALAEEMLTLYSGMLDPADRMRIERIEMFDEFEEWHLIMSHYCISVGVKDKMGVLEGFELKVDKTMHAPPSPALQHGPGTTFRRPLPNAD